MTPSPPSPLASCGIIMDEADERTRVQINSGGGGGANSASPLIFPLSLSLNGLCKLRSALSQVLMTNAATREVSQTLTFGQSTLLLKTFSGKKSSFEYLAEL